MIRNGKEFTYISLRDYQRFSDPDLNESVLILDQQSIHDTFLSLFRKQVRLTPSQVPLLEYMMRHPEGVSRREIIERKYYESVNPENTLLQNIKRLRTKLEELTSDIEFIETIDGGYKWSWNGEYRLFKHSRDVSTDLLLV